MLFAHTPSRLSFFSSLVLGFLTLVFSAAALGAAWLKVEAKVAGSSSDEFVFVVKGICEKNDADVDGKGCHAWGKKKYFDGTEFEDDGMILWPLAALLTALALLLTLAAFITVLLSIGSVVPVKRAQKVTAPLYCVATIFALAAALLAFTSNMSNSDNWSDYYDDLSGVHTNVKATVSLEVGFFLIVLTFIFSLANTAAVTFPGACGLCKSCVAEEAPFKSMA